ncbi:MAG TPA: beta-propeller domain-containing protein, partial [Nitrososphaera sp.]|nr:beta-propeller domain-containing protein [Nitrososphaera sp.]
MAKYSMFGMAGVGIAAAFGFVIALSSLGSSLSQPVPGGPSIFIEPNGTGPIPFLTASQELRKFTSVDELKFFLLNIDQNRGQMTGMLRESTGSGFFGSGALQVVPESPGAAMSSANGDSAGVDFTRTVTDYSTTNVQVQGVDEPDFLKNDGKYVYVLAGDRLTIVEANPAENAEIVVKVALDIQQGQYLQNMFLSNNTLIILYQEYGEEYVIQEYDFRPTPYYSQKTHALVMDVTDRESPSIVHDYEVSGSYNNARMIGSHVYLITSSELNDYGNPILPRVMESTTTI